MVRGCTMVLRITVPRICFVLDQCLSKPFMTTDAIFHMLLGFVLAAIGVAQILNREAELRDGWADIFMLRGWPRSLLVLSWQRWVLT
jgi:hypothetical protein